MMRRTALLIAIVLLIVAPPACRKTSKAQSRPPTPTTTQPTTGPALDAQGRLRLQPTVESLAQASAFTFAIMSDHKGQDPLSSPFMRNCAMQINQLQAKFVVGGGDHLDSGKKNPFLTFVAASPFWSRHFYPNIADGENSLYAQGNQAAWGAGAPFLKALEMDKRPEVQVRPNGCEYYAKIPVQGYVVHLIQLHYPDEPKDNPAVAFPEDSRKYLLDTLASIDKQPGRDIVVVVAHSGNWPQVLAPQQREKLLAKADLIIGASTHYWTRYDYSPAGPLAINSGSVGYAKERKKPRYEGWVSVHVLKNPLSLLVQYQNAEQTDLQIVGPKFRFIKVIGGKATPALFEGEQQPAKDDE